MKQLEKLWKAFCYAVWWICHEWLFDLGFYVAPVVGWLASRWKIEGREKIPLKGGVVLTVNHLSQWDLTFIYNLMPRSGFFMTKHEYFDVPFLGGFVKLLGAFPVNRGKYDRQALQHAIDLLKAGKLLIVFPEGTRSKNGELHAGHSGAALLAAQAGATVVPVAITGTEKITRLKEYGPDGKKIKPRVLVKVGEPYKLPETDEQGKRPSLEDQTDLMMGKIAELLPPEYQGEYAPAKLATRKAARQQAQAEAQIQRLARKAARQQALSAAKEN